MGTKIPFVVISSQGYRVLTAFFTKKLVLGKAGWVFWDTLSFYNNLKCCFRIFPRGEGKDSDAKSQTGAEIFAPRCSTCTGNASFLKKCDFIVR